MFRKKMILLVMGLAAFSSSFVVANETDSLKMATNAKVPYFAQ
ncbi:MAG: hypothetical protein ACJAYB_002672 [Psychromonas sp.]|jgi:hypothetical protein